MGAFFNFKEGKGLNIKKGFIRSPADSRDFRVSQFTYKTRRPKTKKTLLPRIKINKQIIGDCVAQAARVIKVHQEMQNHPGKNYDFSADFLYAECKKIDGMPDVEGTHPRAVMKVLHKIGACEVGLYPRITKHDVRPQASAEAYENAALFKTKAYARVDTIDEIKLSIEDRVPVLTGYLMTDQMRVDESTYWGLPNGYLIGAHSTAFDGFDDDLVRKVNGLEYKGFFRFPNSWGPEWGDDGYGWISYDFIKYRGDFGMSFFDEAWTSVDMIMPNEETEFMKLWVGKKKFIVNGIEYEMDVPPVNIDGRIMVPIRHLSEHQGFRVKWDQSDNSVTLYR